jgi:hypothetical protein
VKINLFFNLVAGMALTLQPSAGFSSADEYVLRSHIPPKIAEIEIVNPEGSAPKIYLKNSSTPKPLPSVKRTTASLDLVPSLTIPEFAFGCVATTARDIKSLRIEFTGPGVGSCRQTISLKQNGAVLDILSYDTLRFTGRAGGKISLSLVAYDGQEHQDSVLLSHLAGTFDIQLPLSGLGKRLDLRRVTALTIETTEPETELRLDSFILERYERKRAKTSRLGFWVWNYHEALANPQSIFDICRKVGADRLFVQIPSLKDETEIWMAYVRFFQEAKKAGIEAFALDGYPEAIHFSAPLIEKIAKLQKLMSSTELAGVQLDIEPYLLEEFFAIQTGFTKYLATIDKIKSIMRSPAKLSVALPFWFSEHRVSGRPVSFAVMDRVDEVAVMSYRTDVDEVRAITEDTLRYGDLTEKSVWLALETIPLAPERYTTLTPEPRHDLADAYLDRKKKRLVLNPPGALKDIEGFRIQRRITVHPERITFAGQDRKKLHDSVERLVNKIANPSLAGVVIHDLRGFVALSQ